MTGDADHGFITEALPAFIGEAREQIASLEQLLLQLEDAPGDRELLDALFRCAHTVKGSAGIFGLERIVEFMHHVETLLDGLRAGRIALDPSLNTLLLECNDHALRLIEAAGGGEDAAGDDRRDVLVAQLRAAIAAAPVPVPTPAAARGTATGEAGNEAARSGRWHISVRFGPDTFRNGMDPAAILAYLGKLGSVAAIRCDVDAVPALDSLDPETCHMGFEVAFDSAASRDEIEEAFSFVREDARLHLIEPGADPQVLIDLIDSMPDTPRLGEILVAVGAISRAQLDEGLAEQRRSAGSGAEVPRLGDLLHEHAGVARPVIEAASDKQQLQRRRDGPVAEEPRLIRVQADRLDAVINLVGELVIASAGASLLAGQNGPAALIEANAHIGRLVEDIRNGALQLRMVPIGETFARFRRVVRDTAAQLGKDVVLDISGGDTELDKSMVERIADPLMHLVRNALDHGLETPADRLAAGKPGQGRLTLSACHESGAVLIRIRDDGRGIRRRKVLERAWERGLLENGVVPADDAVLKLIFEPGFSTAEQVTNLSGRGVGMDVVRRNIEALRGTVSITSVEGEGSTIDIRLPLTLAIIDGFLVGVDASRFILPLESVVEVIENRGLSGDIDEQGLGCMELRGRVLPVVNLRAVFGFEGRLPPRGSVVVVRCGAGSFGILVDQLLGQHQTVIKPLSRIFRGLRGVSGSSILGNGDVALILEVNTLHASIEGRRPVAALEALPDPSRNPQSA